MQSEKDYFYHYNVFVHNYNFEILIYLHVYVWEYFSETLTNTCQHKIKSFTIEQKHFNKLKQYKWSIVQLVIYNLNGIINITMN